MTINAFRHFILTVFNFGQATVAPDTKRCWGFCGYSSRYALIKNIVAKTHT
jgi:hypothetical protein